MAGPSSDAETLDTTPTGFDSSVPPLHEGATPEEKDAHWLKHVYQGDKMPQLTLRAVVMGGILGMLMAASNLYTTLAIGWAFGVAITACVMSFVIWNAIRGVAGLIIVRAMAALGGLAALGGIWAFGFPKWSAYFSGNLGGSGPLAAGAAAGALSLGVVAIVALLWNRRTAMSILENNCMQSTASAAGYSTGSTIATMFGALLLLSGDGQDSAAVKTWDISPIWVVAVFTLCTGLMGVFLAIPLKRQMINHEQLRFPSGVAAAETLRSLYAQGREALEKAYSLIGGIVVGASVGILNTPKGTLPFLDKILPWRLPEMLPPDGLGKIAGKEVPAFGFEPSVLLIAAGIITRMRVCLSMFIGASILHFLVVPWLVHQDIATVGSGWMTGPDGVVAFDRAQAAENVIKNVELNGAGTHLRITTWSLWGGTALMVMASLTAVAMQWRTIGRAFSNVGGGSGGTDSSIEVPVRWMIIGLIPISIAMLVVQIVAFHISWWAGLIAIAMSFVLSLVACRATGETDTTPIGAMGKVMQLVFAVFHPGQIVPNLASAGIAANSASSSADLLTDLKSGYLLGANPRRQFLAQFFGVFFGTLAIVPIWFLMVPSKAHLEKFAAPATRTWEAVARVLTKGIEFLPVSARWAILIGGLVGILLPLIERVTPAKMRRYLPSAMGLGLSWVVFYSNAVGFMTGALIIWLWELLNRKHADKYAVSLASGCIAGESLIKAVIAMTATAIGLFGSGAATP